MWLLFVLFDYITLRDFFYNTKVDYNKNNTRLMKIFCNQTECTERYNIEIGLAVDFIL